jgi:hypothetical protein
MKNCNICEKELDAGTIDSINCGGDCMECAAFAEDPDCAEVMSWVNGFNAACNLLAQDVTKDRYGIGSMCSQWTADDVADDLKARAMEAFNARKTD